MSGARASVTVDFFADLSCPWCYVGWAALKQAAAARHSRVAVSLAWRTFLLSPEMPAEGVDRSAYFAERWDPARLAAAHAALEQAARAADAPLDLGAAARIPNTIDAHRVVHWAVDFGLAEAVIDALFHSYFAEGADIGARDTLIEIAAAAGLDREPVADWLASDKDRALMLEYHEAAAKAGMSGVPVAIFARKVPLLGAQSAAEYEAALDAAA